MEFSVLMSVYYKEKPEFLAQSLESVLQQTSKPSEIVLVKDGPLTEGLEEVLRNVDKENPGLFRFVPLSENVGLGKALARGVQECSHELIARMDTDDIAVSDRFERQLKEFEQNPQLDICGSHIKEFEDDINHTTGARKVPIYDADIKEYQKRRDAFNHMTVMYKKSKVLAAGNYQHALLMEDSLLWVNMIMTGANCKNIDDYLVFARADSSMIGRRGGFSYFLKYRQGRKCIKKTGYISAFDYYYTLLVQLVVALIPVGVRKKVFRCLLRSNV